MKLVCLLVVVTVVVSCCLVAHTSAYRCEYRDGSDVWNLAPMTQPESDPYKYVNTISNETYYVNICERTDVGCRFDAGVCLEYDRSFFDCGDYRDYSFSSYNPNPSENGVTLVYSNGDVCTGVPRVSVIDILCDETVSEGIITDVTEHVECRYNVKMKSQWGCKNFKPKNPLATKFSVPIIATGYLPSSPSVFGQRTEQSTAQGSLYFDQDNAISKFNGTVLKPDQYSGNQAGFMMISKQQLKVRMPLSGQCAIDKTGHKFPLLNQAAGHFLGNATYTSLFFNQGETIQVTTWGKDSDSNKVLLKLEAETNALVWIDGRLLDASGDSPRGWTSLDNYQVEADWKKFKASLPPSIFSVPSAWECL